MSEPARRLATYADLLASPDDVRAEILAGEVLVQPSPTPAHQSTVAEIYAELRGPFQRGRGGTDLEQPAGSLASNVHLTQAR